jgi:hypothetical protein
LRQLISDQIGEPAHRAAFSEGRVTKELQATVEDAYRVFARYSLGGDLVACHCDVCMTEEAALELSRTPLRQIPPALLAEYTNSAHDWDDTVVARQLRYFLPRYLELIAANDPPDGLGLGVCLRRLGYADWRAKWPAEEGAALDRFFGDLTVASLSRLDVSEWPAGWRLDFDMREVLTLVVTAGGDLGRVLARWDAAKDPSAAIHMAGLRLWVNREEGRTYLHDAHLEEFEAEADRIGAFLMRPEVDERIAAAREAVDDARLRAVLSEGQ